MKLSALIYLVFLISTQANATSTLESLAELEWKNRILLISSGDNCERFKKVLLENKEQILDRDVVWFLNCSLTITSNYTGALSDSLQESLSKNNEFSSANIILIGKDGGKKLRSSALNLDQIFSKIDSMPMRIEEMKRANN